MRRSLGTAVLFGMLGVTCFGLLFTPAFYTFVRNFGRNRKERELSQAALKATAIVLPSAYLQVVVPWVHAM